MSNKIIVVNFQRNYFNIILFISFSIPKNNRNLWIDILDLPSNIPNSARICSNHFSENSFDTSGLLTRLRPNALPLKVQNVEVEEKEKEDCFVARCK
jgi:hypothetical protein